MPTSFTKNKFHQHRIYASLARKSTGHFTGSIQINNLSMTCSFFSSLIISLSLCCSCKSQPGAKKDSGAIQSKAAESNLVPDFNYTIKAPENWTVRDTMMEGLRVRLLLPPKSLRVDYPTGNILIATMQGQEIGDFLSNNINNLKSNMQGITILEKGNIDSTQYNGRWFTYTKEQNGIVRDMIFYAIPLNGFAYMITCGTNTGSMNKYRDIFDKIARSFKE
jgi:PsbP-like protein